jgi:hypothetical protein
MSMSRHKTHPVRQQVAMNPKITPEHQERGAVTMIDDDLGRSGSGLVERPGFQRLVASVCSDSAPPGSLVRGAKNTCHSK